MTEGLGTQAISAEIRWFIPGEIPPPVFSWFENISKPEKRSDRYLLLEDATSGSVKLRQYEQKKSWNLEVKLLRGAISELIVEPQVHGVAQEWVKWSFGAPPVEPLVSHLLKAQSGDYVDVEKTRYLRKFAVDGSMITEKSSSDRPERGCNYELTGLIVGNDPWWTICLESFGSAATVTTDLNAVVRHVIEISEPPPVPLTPEASMAYPDWLLSLQSR